MENANCNYNQANKLRSFNYPSFTMNSIFHPPPFHPSAFRERKCAKRRSIRVREKEKRLAPPVSLTERTLARIFARRSRLGQYYLKWGSFGCQLVSHLFPYIIILRSATHRAEGTIWNQSLHWMVWCIINVRRIRSGDIEIMHG